MHTFLCQTCCNLVHISRLWQKCLLQTNRLILSDLRILFWEPQFWACLSFQSEILTVKTQKVILNNSYCLGHPRYLLNISISKAWAFLQCCIGDTVTSAPPEPLQTRPVNIPSSHPFMWLTRLSYEELIQVHSCQWFLRIVFIMLLS